MTPTIKSPCPEKWEGMSPDEQGRFCGKCAAIVIDFTKKTTQEILDFLTARKGEDICGKLRAPKLQPIAIRVSKRTRLFSAAALIVFGSMLFTACGPSEEEGPVGKVGIDSTTQAQQQHAQDSTIAADSAVLANTHVADSTNQAVDMDSSDMMQTMHILDSIQRLLNK